MTSAPAARGPTMWHTSRRPAAVIAPASSGQQRLHQTSATRAAGRRLVEEIMHRGCADVTEADRAVRLVAAGPWSPTRGVRPGSSESVGACLRGDVKPLLACPFGEDAIATSGPSDLRRCG